MTGLQLEYDLRVTGNQLKSLRPYLIGEEPRDNGEWDMYCPLHEDEKRSASLNVRKGKWKCFSTCGGGRVSSLVKKKAEWVDPPGPGRSERTDGGSSSEVDPADVPTEAKVSGWHSSLLGDKEKLKEFKKARGLTTATIKKFQIGFDPNKDAYSIPVRSEDGDFWNIRRYQLDPPPGRRKIWGIKGMNSPRLFPIQVLDENPEEIIICEGELDALIAIQNGFPAITRTGAANVWKKAWNGVFLGKVIYLAHDADETGQEANHRLSLQLAKVAKAVYEIEWPYPIVPKHGKDMTDFLKEYDADALRSLMDAAKEKGDNLSVTEIDPSDATMMDTLDARHVARPLRVEATVAGKLMPGYSIPRKGWLHCSMDKGDMCGSCPLSGAKGRARIELRPENNDTILEVVDAPKSHVLEVFKDQIGVPRRCDRCAIDVEEYQAVEVLFGRPSVEHMSGARAGEFELRRILSVGRHDTPTNTTVAITGSLFPSPRHQRNEFVAWELEEKETTIDNFRLDEEMIEVLKKFQPTGKQTPLSKSVEIARDLSASVTRIVDRDEMHVFMDLIFHSVLSFYFDGERIDKGWVEGLVIGDTRTGKSLVADRLRQHYRFGEMVSCESASMAGIVGGLQQIGGSNEWQVQWGVIPVNDRRLVILDEVSGLKTEDIAQMSSIRSSGEAEIRKIRSAKTPARTRLIWLANPRQGRMNDFTYGVDALKPLIGNPEDIARFTMVMSAKFDEDKASIINQPRGSGVPTYLSDECRDLVMWAASRRPEQVVFSKRATKAIYQSAIDLGKKYIESPPLLQAANARVKVASLAAALAARTFSCDKTGEKVVVRDVHVRDVLRFLDRIYSLEGFGYLDRSREAIKDAEYARASIDRVRSSLKRNKGLAKFLRNSGHFKRQDIEEVLNYDRKMANAVINELHNLRVLRKEGGFSIVTPVLHELLRKENHD